MSADFSYLDILDKKLDKSQRAACCRGLNTVVAAGAGSGKTQVLATRFAWLVMSCNIKVEEILALTFTKKAASEIYQRIYKTLGQFAANTQTPPEEKARAKQALKDFDKAHIQTLDSYSSTVVRQAANRYGINPNFTVAEVENLKADAFRFLVNHKDEPALLAVATPGNLHKLAEDLFETAISRYTDITCPDDFFEKKLLLQCRQITEVWNRLISDNANEDYPEEGEGIFSILSEVQSEYQNNPEKIGTPYFDKLEAFLNNEPELNQIQDASMFETDYETLSKMAADASAWTDLFNFPQNTKGYTKPLQAINKQFKEKTKETLDLVTSFILNYQHIKRIFELLDMFMVQINEQKRRSGSLSFGDINSLALKILKEQKEIRNQEKKTFKKIMIDEFQDNNGKNRDMLYLLAEKDDAFTEPSENEKDFLNQLVSNLADSKLYFVGDEKQSIYKFRGADVSVFNSLTEDLAKTVPPETETKLYMTNNYRSTEPVLAMFNRLFGGIGEGEDVNFKIFSNDEKPKQFEAYYTKAATYKDNEVSLPLSKENVPMHVSIFDSSCLKENLPEGKTEDDFLKQNDTAAYYTAKKIRDLFDSEKAAGNSPKYADYAVLCRSRSNYAKLVRWLNAFDVPYNFDQQKSIFDDGPINDIFHFLRLCCAPQDKTSFAAYLCSPFAGLKIQTVEMILGILPETVETLNEQTGRITVHQYTAFSEDKQLEEKIKLEVEALSKDEYQKYLEAKSFYLKMKNQVLTEPLTDTITKLWYETGARYETLLDKKTSLSAEQYDLLFELVRKLQEDGRSTSWIIDQLAQSKQNSKFAFGTKEDELGIKDVSYPIEKDDAVQIMTIHKSKGLEFENVFVLGCISDGGSENEPLIFYDEDFGVSVKIGSQRNYFYKKQKADSEEKDKAEFKRLVYVAITRARKSVYTVDAFDASNKRTKSCFRDAIEYFYGPEMTSQTELAPMERCYKEHAPFDFELLEKIESDIMVEETEKTADLRLNAFAKLEKLCGASKAGAGTGAAPGAVIVQCEDLPQKRISPSDLEKLHANAELAVTVHNQPINASIAKIDEIIAPQADASTSGQSGTGDGAAANSEDKEEQASARDFTHGTFGTLAHAYLENAIKTGRAEIDFETKELLKKNLSEANFSCLCNICRDMAETFLGSNTGKEAAAAKLAKRFCKSEYYFKLLHNSFIIRGFIDLVYQDSNSKFVIVDYKTDIEIAPEKYYEQQCAYRFAVKEMLGLKDEKEIALKLYFLRYGQEIDITEAVNSISLSEELMQNLLSAANR